MMAYLMERIRLIKEIRWKSCSEYIPEEIASCLTPSEKKFASNYNENLRKYMSSVGIDLTLVRYGFFWYNLKQLTVI